MCKSGNAGPGPVGRTCTPELRHGSTGELKCRIVGPPPVRTATGSVIENASPTSSAGELKCRIVVSDKRMHARGEKYVRTDGRMNGHRKGLQNRPRRLPMQNVVSDNQTHARSEFIYKIIFCILVSFKQRICDVNKFGSMIISSKCKLMNEC